MRDLLAADEPRPLVVLARSSRLESSRQRIESAMQMWDGQLGRSLPRPLILEGDIRQPGLGLSDEQRRWVERNCDAVLHNAASLTFYAEEGRTGEPWASNLDGTRNVVDICLNAGIQTYFHVSTAYVCGLRQGLILESELDVGQEPGNDYERSKIAAEKLVHEAGFAAPPTIFRPSIIVGDSQTGFTSTFHGFYAPLQLAHAVAKKISHIEPSQLRFLSRLDLAGHETKNLVPVEWVSAVICHLVCLPEHHGKTYHLTSPEPTSVDFMQDVILAAVERPAAQAELGLNPAESDALEAGFRERMSVYQSYWRNDPVFDCSNTVAASPDLPCPRLDRPTLDLLARFAVDTRFGWPKPRPTAIACDVQSYLAARWPERVDGAAIAESELLGLEITGVGGGAGPCICRKDIAAAGRWGWRPIAR